MSDKFDKKDNDFESSNEIDDFLKKFDEIKKSFEMADSDTEVPLEKRETKQEEAPRTRAAVSPRRCLLYTSGQNQS